MCIKKLISFILIFLLISVIFAYAKEITIISDDSTMYQDYRDLSPSTIIEKEKPDYNALKDANWIKGEDVLQKNIELPECTKNLKGTLVITSDLPYYFYINEGNERINGKVGEIGTYDITPYLEKYGINTLYINAEGEVIYSLRINYDECSGLSGILGMSIFNFIKNLFRI